MKNNILFVDDEQDILNSYVKLFENEVSPSMKELESLLEMEDDSVNQNDSEEFESNYAFFKCSQGLDAVEIVKDQLKKNNPIKVIFMDIRMPPGISGAEATKMIKDIDQNVEIVLVTAYSDTNLSDIIKSVGRPDKILYLRKPFDPEEVKQLAHNLSSKYNSERIKESFMSNITHELSTPLASILGFSDLLKDDESLTDEKKKYFDIIYKNAKLLRLLIDDLLTLESIKDNNLKFSKDECSLDIVTEFAYQSLVSSEDISSNVKINLEEGIKNSVFLADASRIHQVLMNLISNSIKFTKDGNITISATTDTEKCNITISDTGIGIPEDKIKSIFEQFTRLENDHHSQPGMGLGLSIAKYLIEEQGGEITCQSQINQGTKITVSFPLLKACS